MKEYKLGIIGGGNMASAIIKGIVEHNILSKDEFIVSDPDLNKLNFLYSQNINTTAVNEELVEKCEYILLAVKPQAFKGFSPDLFKRSNAKVVISIMAGVNINTISKIVGHKHICRIMPNLALMVGAGMSALAFNECNEIDKDFIKAIFASIGTILEVEETKLDAVTSISGSGPAYVFYFINAMINGGMDNGLTEEEAKVLTLATLKGAVKVVEESSINLDKLIDNVCSKGGTTIEAINHFDENNMDTVIIEGINKCYKRSVELSKL